MEMNLMLESLKTGGIARSPKWNEVRDVYLKTHANCVVCGISDGLEVHHIFPFNYCIELGRPDLELNPENFMTLCEAETANEHHLLVGHLDNWASYNPDVLSDIRLFKGMTKQQLKINKTWLAKVANRPKPVSDMTQTEKDVMLKELNKRFPKK